MFKKIGRKTTRRIGTALLAAPLLGSVASGATAAKPHSHKAQTVKPTIVFVHGAWADSSGWNPEITRLERLGYPVIAAPNELRDLASDSDYVRSILQTINGPIVLVGHSYGGAVITNAAVGVPNVKALVFINAFAPDKGESLAQLSGLNPGSLLGPDTLVQRSYPLSDGTEGTDLYLTEKGFETAFANDLPTKVADQMWAEQRPLSQTAFTAASGDPAWKTIPSWYQVGTQDRAIPPATQMFMAKRMNATITTVKASHVSMLSHPKATTSLILEAAAAAG